MLDQLIIQNKNSSPLDKQAIDFEFKLGSEHREFSCFNDVRCVKIKFCKINCIYPGRNLENDKLEHDFLR